MSTYYSVIFASVNSVVSEQLTIGLIMSDGKNLWFRYSKAKLSFMRNFFDSEAFLLLKTSLKNIELVVSSHLNKAGKPEDVLFNTPTGLSPFSIEHMRYLSRYSNATITYNNPVEIEAEASDELFNHLYSEFVFREQKTEQKKSEIEIVKNKLRPHISKHVNWDYRIETGLIPGLIIPVELDFIGKNEQAVVGKITDFDQPNYNLDASLSNVFVLMKTFEAQKERGIYYIVGKEPNKKNKKQHQTWHEVRNSSFVKYVHIDETELISDYMKNHSVKPYF